MWMSLRILHVYEICGAYAGNTNYLITKLQRLRTDSHLVNGGQELPCKLSLPA